MAVSKAWYFHIRPLHRIWKSLPDDVAKTVAWSIVSSHLHCCNSLYTGCLKQTLPHYGEYRTLMHASWPATRKWNISPVLANFHWLPIKSRMTFKSASLTYSIRKSGQPAYLQRLIPDYKLRRNLRSSSYDLIATKGSKNAKGVTAFSCIALCWRVYHWQWDIVIQLKLFENI